MKIYSYTKEVFPDGYEINTENIRERDVKIAGTSIPKDWGIKQKQLYIQTELNYHYKRLGKENIDNLHILKNKSTLGAEFFTIICDIFHKVYYSEIEDENLVEFMKKIKRTLFN